MQTVLAGATDSGAVSRWRTRSTVAQQTDTQTADIAVMAATKRERRRSRLWARVAVLLLTSIVSVVQMIYLGGNQEPLPQQHQTPHAELTQ